MCITIALALEKKKGEDNIRKWNFLPWRLWWMYPTIGRIPDSTFRATLETIRKHVLPNQFIHEYSVACEILGIPENDQAFSENLFYSLIDEVTGIDNKMAKACEHCESFVDHYIHRLKRKN